jgi:hypothetical protein
VPHEDRQPAPDINLPHAHTIVGRLVRWVQGQTTPPYQETRLPEILADLDRLLRPYEEDPPQNVARQVAEAARALGHALVRELEGVGYQGDRLGQCVRNLFECLGQPAEGAALSLRCGERPDSPLRP